MLLALALIAGLTAGDTTAARSTGIAPAAVIVHTQPAIPIVALRMSLLGNDPAGYSGAGYLFQMLALPRLREQVARVGGQVQIQRNADAMVYTVVGPAAELEFLAATLRSVLAPPAAGPGQMVGALLQLEEGRLAEWEIAENHVRATLRSRLFPEALPPAGTVGSAARLDAALLRPLWGELYRPEQVMVVAVGDVGLEQVRRVFADLPAPPRDRLRTTFADTVPLARLAPAEATRAWLGIGYSAAGLDAAAVTVTARLLGDALRERLPTTDLRAEHWWTHQGQALALVAATPEPQLAAARRALGAGVSALQESLTERLVRDAATAVRREMLHFARTPERMAEVVGSFADREGDPDASQRFFAELQRVRVQDVERVLQQLSRRTPVRMEIPPQVLRRS
jgi:predicted Zn-dependent peptidase